MKAAYFDCFSGIAGDMCLGALLDAGWPESELRAVVARLGLADVSVSAAAVSRSGLAATHVEVRVAPAARKRHRHLPQILTILQQADLPEIVRSQAVRVFQRLAEAEAAVHGTAVEKVHFHEVGADDALVDIVGTCAGLHALGVERVYCSPIPTGHGTVHCEHGAMPIPAPATARLLRGVPLAPCDEPGELATPTGAALAVALAAEFGPLPAMRLEAIGYGAGTRQGQTRPNVLRVLIGDVSAQPAPSRRTESSPAVAETATHDVVAVLEAQMDDADGQGLAYACERLLAAGALDAFLTPILMKKGRPGHLLTVLAERPDAERLGALILAETTTLGVRRHDAARRKLPRQRVEVSTRYGAIRVKVAGEIAGGGHVAGDHLAGEIAAGGGAIVEPVRAWPEYEDCAAAAARAGVALRVVQEAALDAWRAGRAKP